ncbi:MAG: NUDIX hydrolase [Acidobacteriota bacterium]
MNRLLAIIFLLTIFMNSSAQTSSYKLPRESLRAGYWPVEKSQPIIEKTQTIRLSPDLTNLSTVERAAIAKLLEVGILFQNLYEQQRHAQALSLYRELEQTDKLLGSPAATQNLLALYRLNQGPIAITLENKREAFLPATPPPPGKNVYPWGVTKNEIDAFLTAHPDKRDIILASRTVVRRANRESLQRDLAKLRRYAVLDTLHPRLRKELTDLLAKPDTKQFYAIPYAVAYADELIRVYTLLNEAAELVEKDDEEFARYLRNRSRDLLSNDYESGDAAWVTGQFKNLNAQIGAYEVYDDELYGVKTFFSFSLLMSRPQETTALRQALKGLQTLEDLLPYQHHKKVKEDIPVGVYDVIADFAQARGGNTATILPNESLLARRYGRIIMLRANIMRNPDLFSGSSRVWETALASVHKNELSSDGSFYRTLWHEIGHYLGVDKTKDETDLDTALQENASALEEMKADLVSLFVAKALHQSGYYTADQLRAVYASGINRVLQNNKPRRDQPYNTMQLMQWNFFLAEGLLSFDSQNQKLVINYQKYHEVVEKLLAKVLEIQYQGDKSASDKFIEQYTNWDENLHGVIAKNIRNQQQYRFRLFKYAALNE